MSGTSETAFSTLSMGVRAAAQVVKSTGGRDEIITSKMSGGAALSLVSASSSGQGVSESGKGGSVSIAS